jgi:hypothetical protein
MAKLNCNLFCPIFHTLTRNSHAFLHIMPTYTHTHTHTHKKHSPSTSSFILEFVNALGLYYFNDCISKVKHTDCSHSYQIEVWQCCNLNRLILLQTAVRWVTMWKRGYLNKKNKTRSHNLEPLVVGIWNGQFQNKGATLLELPGVATIMRTLYQQSAVLSVCSRCISQELLSCWWNRYTCSTQRTWTHGTKNHSSLPRSCSRL